MTITNGYGSKSAQLRKLLGGDRLARVVGVGDGLSALLASRHGFDALWGSGLSISAAHALPDASILTMTEFLQATAVIDAATPLPTIADCDTGFGDVNVVMRATREYERRGIAGICMEDKQFPKRNSFSRGQQLAPIAEFAQKIRAAKSVQVSPDFVVIARVESLIAETGMADALERGARYAQAGADALLIHSKSESPDEVLEFAARWHQQNDPLPLVAVPTTYYSASADELERGGFSMVIYANQSLRAVVRVVDDVFARLSRAASTAEMEEQLIPVVEVLDLIGMDSLLTSDVDG
ncbi:isocitrate lyase/phosphoenolpyruvate mutase family protein [Nocardia amamiensis]|uniref:isocitrate lyase/phosphoenolpyruvate mutase family protein n=1 Tax=Nocardia amamiensis TaxID=404578 RepID=UPI000833E56F|nr:isocitrate lyase/phosphoenolpyruvate mutase family protein [Nocardia amamiensis]